MSIYVAVCVVMVGLAFVVMVVMMCKFVQETLGLLRPVSMPYRNADQARRIKVQDATRSKRRELRHTDGSVNFNHTGGEIADELMNTACQITLCNIQKDKSIQMDYRSVT